MVGKKIFVLWGDAGGLDEKVRSIGSSIRSKCPSLESLDFSHREEEVLKEIQGFAFSPRLFIINNPHKIGERTKESLKSFIARGEKDYFIFKISSTMGAQALQKDGFIKFLFKHFAPRKISGAGYPFSSLYKSLDRKNIVDILFSLDGIFSKSVDPEHIVSLKILGIMAKYCGMYENYSSRQKALKLVLEADRRIKLSKVNSRYALEILFLRLFGGRGKSFFEA